MATNRRNQIVVRISSEKKEVLRAIANKNKKTMSELIREYMYAMGKQNET